MNHPDDEIILKYALETLDHSELPSVGAHIAGCPRCLSVLSEINGDIRLLGEYDPRGVSSTRPAPPLIPMPPPVNRMWFRAAAAVAVILLGGYLAIRSGTDDSVTVVPQRFVPPAVVIPAGEFAPCEAVDIAHT